MTDIKTENSLDLLIIGGGPAGGTAADRALDSGGKVALIEPDHIGVT